jgi:MFS family permease
MAGAKWLFPFGLVLVMASASANFGTLAASVASLKELYPDQSAFMVNFVNFNYFWLFLIIGPFVPKINRTIPRGVVLLACSIMMLVGSVLQATSGSNWGFGGFYWLLSGSLISNVPQPILVASVADTLAEYTSPRHEALFLGLYVAVQNISFGLHYLLAVWYLDTADKFDSNLNPFVVSWSALALAALIVSCLYINFERHQSDLCLVDVQLPTRTIPSIEVVGGGCWFWAFMVSYAVQNAVGNILALFFDELATAQHLLPEDITVIVLVIGTLIIPLPIIVGLLLDCTQSWRLLPWCILALQAVFQTMIFYWTSSPLESITVVVAFALCNNALTIVFLPSLVRLTSTTGENRSFVNATMTWFTTLCTAMGNLLTLSQTPPLFTLLKYLFPILGFAATTFPIILWLLC